jgi:hypothetical protein
MAKRTAQHVCRWARPERVRQPQARRRPSALWADCQAAMAEAVTHHEMGYRVQVCRVWPRPLIIGTRAADGAEWWSMLPSGRVPA